MGTIRKEMNSISQSCLNCNHKKISHMKDIFDKPQGRMKKAFGTCEECKKESKNKICHEFKSENS